MYHVEVNTCSSANIRFRNFVYFCHTISNKTKKGKNYDLNYKYVHIDFTYGIKDKYLYNEYYVQTGQKSKYTENVKIIEYNMDYLKDNWYNKPELKYIAMLDMEPLKLEEIGKEDEVVMEYKKSLEELNENEEFQSFMSAEEAYNMQYNTDIQEAMKQGIEQGFEKGIEQRNIELVISMKDKGFSMSEIEDITKLDKIKIEEILNKKNEEEKN